ncbi:hypothetical protein D9N18_02610 [Lactococcus raffinolactis]|nr:hypothetical protein [Lactococcus raffinolactis]
MTVYNKSCKINTTTKVVKNSETKAHQKTGDYSKNKSFKPNSNSIEKRQKQDLKNLTLEN